MILAPVILPRYFDANGKPLSGGKLFTYAAGTTTPQATYTDQSGDTPNTNPVILDANGEVSYWLDPSLAYKFILKDSNDVVQGMVDNVSGAGLTGSPKWNANSNYQRGDIVADSDGIGQFFVSQFNNNLDNDLHDVSFWRRIGGNIRDIDGSTSILATEELVRSDSTAANITLRLPSIAGTPVGVLIVFKDVGTGGFATSLRGGGTDLIDGDNIWAVTLKKNDVAGLKNNGTSWDVVFSYIFSDGFVTGAKLATSAADGATLEVASGSIRVKDGGITAAKMATDSVPTAAIVAGNVTSAKLATNLNMPGNTVQENGRNVVVSNTNAASSLAIVRIGCNSAGALTIGEGASCALGANYVVTFTTAFATLPVVNVTCLDASGGAFIATLVSISVSAVAFKIYQVGVGLSNSDFLFTAIGPRA